MASKSTADHDTSELEYLGWHGDVAAFQADSKSQPGRKNIVCWDRERRVAWCGCAAGERGEACWHAGLVEWAYLEECARQIVEALPDRDAVVACGLRARARIDTGRGDALDRAVYLAAKYEWLARRARQAA